MGQLGGTIGPICPCCLLLDSDSFLLYFTVALEGFVEVLIARMCHTRPVRVMLMPRVMSMTMNEVLSCVFYRTSAHCTRMLCSCSRHVELQEKLYLSIPAPTCTHP